MGEPPPCATAAAAPRPGHDARAELRSMWQLPAAWRVLHLLARPLAHAAPAPPALEDALLSPADHAQIVANAHGRLLGLSAGKSSEAKWIPAVARFARSFPGTFGPILGSRARKPAGPDGPDEAGDRAEEDGREHPSVVTGAAATEETNEGAGGATSSGLTAVNGETPEDIESGTAPELEPRVFTSMEEYAGLAPSVRLLVLHAIAEIVICEHDTLLQAGSLADVDADDLRLEPIGVDARGSVYWYFGDELSLYREPDERAMRAREKNMKQEAEREAKRAAEAALKEQSRERKERRSAVRSTNSEKWAPRVAATRSTRASLAREREIFEESAQAAPSAVRRVGESDDGTRGPTRESRRRRSASREQDAGPDASVSREHGDTAKESRSRAAENMERITSQAGTDEGRPRRSGRARRDRQAPEEAPRTPSRKRSLVSPESAPVASPAASSKKPRRGLAKEFADPSLRDCSGWERVCAGPDELRTFIARFGPLKDISDSAERTLVRRFEEELLPILDEATDRIRKEEEKRLRAEWLASNLKKSSRVTALEQKRKQEQELAAAREAEEAEKQRRLAERVSLIESTAERLERDIVRELKRARRKLERSGSDNSTQNHTTAMSREERAKRRASGIGLSGSGSEAGASDHEMVDPPKQPEISELPDSDDAKLTGTVPQRPGSSGIEGCQNSEPEGQKGAALGGSFGENTQFSSVSSVGNSDNRASVEFERRPRTSTAVWEEDIPPDYTWIVVADDGLPTRSLTTFMFVRALDLSLASLEETSLRSDSADSQPVADVFGYGVLIPPPTSDAVPLRVELGRICEWVIEYGAEPRLWVKTEKAWYELKNPATDYAKTFSTALRKYEICARLRILVQSFRGEQLAYDNVVQLLGMRYMNMRGYKEHEIEEEAPFILEQVQTLAKASLLKCGFIRELERKQRDAIKQREKEEQRLARDEERARQAKARAEEREAEKRKQQADRAAAAAERARLVEERKLRKSEPSKQSLFRTPNSSPASKYPTMQERTAVIRDLSKGGPDTPPGHTRPDALKTLQPASAPSQLIRERDLSTSVGSGPHAPDRSTVHVNASSSPSRLSHAGVHHQPRGDLFKPELNQRPGAGKVIAWTKVDETRGILTSEASAATLCDGKMDVKTSTNPGSASLRMREIVNGTVLPPQVSDPGAKPPPMASDADDRVPKPGPGSDAALISSLYGTKSNGGKCHIETNSVSNEAESVGNGTREYLGRSADAPETPQTANGVPEKYAYIAQAARGIGWSTLSPLNVAGVHTDIANLVGPAAINGERACPPDAGSGHATAAKNDCGLNHHSDLTPAIGHSMEREPEAINGGGAVCEVADPGRSK